MIISPRKVYWWVVGGEWWQTKFNVSPGPGLWSLVLGSFGPDLGPDLDLTWDQDLDLTWDQDLDLSLTIRQVTSFAKGNVKLDVSEN